MDNRSHRFASLLLIFYLVVDAVLPIHASCSFFNDQRHLFSAGNPPSEIPGYFQEQALETRSCLTPHLGLNAHPTVKLFENFKSWIKFYYYSVLIAPSNEQEDSFAEDFGSKKHTHKRGWHRPYREAGARLIRRVEKRYGRRWSINIHGLWNIPAYPLGAPLTQDQEKRYEISVAGIGHNVIQLNVPKPVHDFAQLLSSDGIELSNSVDPQMIMQAVIAGEGHDCHLNPSFFIWTLRHYAELDSRLNDREQNILEFAMFHSLYWVAHFDSRFDALSFQKNGDAVLEAWWYLQVHILAASAASHGDTFFDRKHRALLMQYARLIQTRTLTAYYEGWCRTDPKQYFMGRLDMLAQQHPEIGIYIDRTRQQWSSAKSRNLLPERVYLTDHDVDLHNKAFPLRPRSLSLAEQEKSGKMKEWITLKLNELVQAMGANGDVVKTLAWETPLTYITQELVSESERLIIYAYDFFTGDLERKKEEDNDDKGDPDPLAVIFPELLYKEWNFQLQFLREMAYERDFRTWVFTSSIDWIEPLHQWAHDQGASTPLHEYISRLQSYLDPNPPRAEKPVTNIGTLKQILQLPDAPSQGPPEIVLQCLDFWVRVEQIARMAKTRVLLMTDLDDYDKKRNSDAYRQMQVLLDGNEKMILIGKEFYDHSLKVKDRKHVGILHLKTQETYSNEERLFIPEIFQFASYVIGKAKGWPDLLHHAAVPLKGNTDLEKFFERSEPQPFDFDWRSVLDRFNSLKNRFDSLVFSSIEEDSDSKKKGPNYSSRLREFLPPDGEGPVPIFLGPPHESRPELHALAKSA